MAAVVILPSPEVSMISKALKSISKALPPDSASRGHVTTRSTMMGRPLDAVIDNITFATFPPPSMMLPESKIALLSSSAVGNVPAGSPSHTAPLATMWYRRRFVRKSVRASNSPAVISDSSKQSSKTVFTDAITFIGPAASSKVLRLAVCTAAERTDCKPFVSALITSAMV